MAVERPMGRYEVALREDLIRIIPRRPNSKESYQTIQSFSTFNIIAIYLTWKSRFVVARPRKIKFWLPGIDEARLIEIKHGLGYFLRKVANGEDLTPHLSDLIRTNGYIMGPPKDGDADNVREDDKDMILIRLGLYHFHVGIPDETNPKGRSNLVIFTEVTDDDITVVSICDHDEFDRKKDGFKSFSAACDAYIQRNMRPGTLYMANPVTISGHSSDLTDHAIYCTNKIREYGDEIGEGDFVREFFESRNLQPPKKPKLKWHFEHLDLCLKAPGGALVSILPYRY